MTRAPKFVRLIQSETAAALHEQLYQRVRELILSGELGYGARLASSRSLAASVGMSRNSVLTAIDRLVSDGLLESRKGSGAYVCYKGVHSRKQGGSKTLPEAAALLPFALGVPPVDIFPSRIWQRLQSRRWKHISSVALHEGDPLGWEGLREAITTHAAMTRGLQCVPDQVMIVGSVSTAIDLAVRALELSAKPVWMEDPGYSGARRVLKFGDVRIVPVPVDAFGLDVNAGRALAPDAKAAFVTPACHFPTNVTMSKVRRCALLDWAREKDSWILEDDFDWSATDLKSPPQPLAAVDPVRTIYTNTFNHLLFPSLRIAYLIVPLELVERFAAIQRGLSASSNVPNQMVMADFINQGHLDEHLARLKASREERRAALSFALGTILSPYLTAIGNQTGSHIVCSTKIVIVEKSVAACRARNIAIETMSKYRMTTSASDQIILGYPGFTPKTIAEASAKLRDVFADLDLGMS